MNKTIRAALLIDSTNIQAWVYHSIAKILTLDHVQICCVFIDQHATTESTHGWLRKKLDRVANKISAKAVLSPDYRERKNSLPLLENIAMLSLSSETDFSPLKNHQAHVLINFTPREVHDETALSLPFGVWHHLFNAGTKFRPGYEGFWEYMLPQPEVGSSLLIEQADLTEGLFFNPSYSCTFERSLEKTNQLNYWKSSSFAARALTRIQQAGHHQFLPELVSKQITSSTRESNRAAPDNGQYLGLLVKKIAGRILSKIKHRNRFDQWTLLFRLNPEHSWDISRYQPMLSPKEVFWADPHVIFENDTYYIFIEEMPFATWKGYLSVIEMDQQGNYSAPTKILEENYHLSYPNVFKIDGVYYMIPESTENQTISLYRCTEFPHQWSFVMNLMEDVNAVDATLHFSDNKWWLFANIMENDGASAHDELYLFYAEPDFRTNQWTPHPLNPIVSDVKTARPAGKIFSENGKLYRPSQNCSVHYGYGLNINQITHLSETDYAEITTRQIKPDWDKNFTGIHTYSRAKDLVLVDGILQREK